MSDVAIETSPAQDMATNVANATAFLKTLAHEGRLMILCHLESGEKSVGELEVLLDIRQAIREDAWSCLFDAWPVLDGEA